MKRIRDTMKHFKTVPDTLIQINWLAATKYYFFMHLFLFFVIFYLLKESARQFLSKVNNFEYTEIDFSWTTFDLLILVFLFICREYRELFFFGSFLWFCILLFLLGSNTFSKKNNWNGPRVKIPVLRVFQHPNRNFAVRIFQFTKAFDKMKKNFGLLYSIIQGFLLNILISIYRKIYFYES